MAHPCPDCGGDLRKRTSKRLARNRRVYLDCRGCGTEWVATIQPEVLLNIAKKSCNDNKSHQPMPTAPLE